MQNIKSEHHVYERVWAPVTGEELSVFPEENNIHNRYAISVTILRTLSGLLYYSS